MIWISGWPEKRTLANLSGGTTSINILAITITITSTITFTITIIALHINVDISTTINSISFRFNNYSQKMASAPRNPCRMQVSI